MNELPRRLFLTGAVVAAGGAGIGVGLVTGPSHRRTAGPSTTPTGPGSTPTTEPVASAALVAAIRRETALLARYTAATPTPSGKLVTVAAHHRAHLRALRALAASGATSDAPTPPPAAPVTVADALGWETDAARAASATCIEADADLAALLASIAACEATHAVWLA